MAHLLDQHRVVLRGLVAGPQIIPTGGVSASGAQEIKHWLVRQAKNGPVCRMPNDAVVRMKSASPAPPSARTPARGNRTSSAPVSLVKNTGPVKIRNQPAAQTTPADKYVHIFAIIDPACKPSKAARQPQCAKNRERNQCY